MRDEEGRTQHIHEEQLHESARIAVRWARTHRVSREVSAAPSPLARLESCRERLARAHERFQQQADEGGALSVAGEWLLDNYYVILQAFRLVREDLPEGYYKRLPKLAEGEFSGHPRVYALAREIVAYTGGRLSDQILRELLRAYQAEQPLTMGEIWALPTMLRVALLELLAASVDPGGERASGVEAIPGTVPSDLLAEQMISRYVPSLHQLATLDWDAFFDAVSLVEEVLCEDPDGSYARMEFDSRDRYRKVIEELALRSEAEELQVAQAAIELAKAHGSSSAGPTRQRHVGYYLVDEGRAKLEGVIRYRLAPFQRFVRLLGRHRLALYLGSIGMVAALVLVALLFSAQSWQSSIGQLLVLALLAAVPALGLAVNLVNVVVTRVLPPRVLPKLDLSEGVPAEFRTMVVIPGLLGDERDVDELLQQIELHYLSSRDANLGYALLTDFPDAPQETMPGDEVLIERAVSGIRALNERYPREGANPFYLFHRKRLWNPAENVWMGWERKRGKLEEFNKLLLGQGDTSFAIQIGDLSFLSQVRYVITLDADTVLPRDTASRLIGALAHPLNRAVFSPDGRRVIAGYTVLQPRAEIKPTTASRSLFTDVFSGDIGIDLYTRAVSDPYQDLFGEGIFVGKGIYDVAAFTRSLEGRVPENALLSHDLFEGIHGRAGLVTDVLLYEDYPPNYLAYAHRLHRWVRGDWQLLPWLGRRVPSREGGKRPNDLSALDRWKILDNLRRSLHQPMMLLLLVVGWLWLPGSPLFWTLASLALWGLPTLWALLEGLVQHALGRAGLGRAVRQALRTLLFIVLIPYEALLMTDAIISTLIRLYITRRKLLQWTTAAHTVRLFGGERQVAVLWGQMKGALFLSLGIAVLIAILRPLSLVVAAPFLLVWCLSPQIVYVIERPRRIKRQELNANEIEELRRLARRTWLYFERFVGPEDNWLPPDHFQEDPRGLVAHRTSPTNIGLLLMSTLGAYDLGYMGIMELELRLDSTLGSLQQMRRHRGHLLNWYNTETLEPLPPLYVSTVDSGNLAASLLVVARGLEELGRVPVFRWQEMRGLLDALGVLHEVVEAARGEATGGGVRSLAELLEEVHRELVSVRDEPSAWVELLARLADDVWHQVEERLRELIESQGRDLGVGTLRDLRTWAERVHRHMHTLENEVGILQPWLFLLPAAPSWLDSETGEVAARWRALRAVLPQSCLLEELPNICTVARERLGELLVALGTENDGLEGHQEVREWGEQLAEELETARRVAQGLLNDARALAEQMNALVAEMRFDFLLDRRREVFYLGYHVSEERVDEGHYDLLASEARIASLVAIAKGEAPRSHWLHLGRPLTRVDGLRMLLSWNGSMFEYLMPILYMRRYEGMLLSQTYEAAVLRQIAYARSKGVPWGISESGYYSFDAERNYQYRGFGVPGMGRKRGLGDDLVVAPYASLLAVTINPKEVVRNVAHLKREEMLGSYGFYEAIDYTKTRLPPGQKKARVLSFMAHHQGMSLVALTNYLTEEALVERFHRIPMIQTVELLLQEQVPAAAPIEEATEQLAGALPTAEGEVDIGPWTPDPNAQAPQVHYLSNGRYGVLLSTSGGGFSCWGDVQITRWRADPTLDNWGSWLYLQDRETGHIWSLTRQPLGAATNQQCRFYAHKVEYRAQFDHLTAGVDVTVCSSDDLEIRRVTLTNHGDRPRRLRLLSYAEVAMSTGEEDKRHPAFNKLFIESEWLPEKKTQLLRRRKRSEDEQPVLVAHTLYVPEGENYRLLNVEHEGSRANFLGRGNTLRNPQALSAADAKLSGSVGATLDPILAIGQELELGPHASCILYYLTCAGSSREMLLHCVDGHCNVQVLEGILHEGEMRSRDELAALNLEAADLARYQQLLSALLYPHRRLRAPEKVLRANRRGQQRLWPYAISGDYPILLVRIERQEDAALLRDVLRAHAYWRQRGLLIDLVILNEKEAGYAGELDALIRRLVARSNGESRLNRRGGIYILHAYQMDDQDRMLLLSAARVLLDAAEGTLEAQLRREWGYEVPLPDLVATRAPDADPPTEPIPRPAHLEFDNGYGGFRPDGAEYWIYLEPGQKTPAPWCNVVANAEFGFLISEQGSSFTWAGNSGENRLTPWNNDPVSDEPGEVLYLRDEETTEVWSPTPLPARESSAYLIRHGIGYTIFAHRSHGLEQEVRLYVAPQDPVKLVALRVRNIWNRPRRVTATYYAEWVLGVIRHDTQQYVLPDFDADVQVLLATNPYNEEFGQRTAFLTSSEPIHGLTTDRSEFLGRYGSKQAPAALRRIGLASCLEAGRDPCAALQIHLDIPANGEREVYFVLGQGTDRESAVELARLYREPERAAQAWEEMRRQWDQILGVVQVDTPDEAMNMLLNRWSLYQALSCRLWGRSAFYQSSGAFGFRDQLQDVMALLHSRPELAREHLLRAAAHQFEAGDVLHWWHPPSGRGVRTRISDDLLWLPFCTAEYVQVTGDEAILREEVPFLRGDPLKEGEEERYGLWQTTEEGYSLYEHCRRAIEEGTTSGLHGLPLMGTGDWNDGMNRVGREGRGESVWLAWFLAATLDRFAPLAESWGDQELARNYRERARQLRRAVNETAWDGEWYLRAFYDDGEPLGSSRNIECQIDSLAQSWAVLWQQDDLPEVYSERPARAVYAALQRLYRPEDALILLFAPPFDETPHDPGYIKGYPPGVRENGGQYTHAAVWLTWSVASLGRGDLAYELFRALNPLSRATTTERVERYRVEPYVVAADIYALPPHVGRGGWTWYTGSAAWLYRLGIEAILGLERRGNTLCITPCIPSCWEGYQITYRYQGSEYHITVHNPEHVCAGVVSVELDGREIEDQAVPLCGEKAGVHEVVVRLGRGVAQGSVDQAELGGQKGISQG